METRIALENSRRDLVLFLFWFRSFTCTVQLLFHSLRERVVSGVGVHLKLDVQGQGSGKIFDIDGQEGMVSEN